MLSTRFCSPASCGLSSRTGSRRPGSPSVRSRCRTAAICPPDHRRTRAPPRPLRRCWYVDCANLARGSDQLPAQVRTSCKSGVWAPFRSHDMLRPALRRPRTLVGCATDGGWGSKLNETEAALAGRSTQAAPHEISFARATMDRVDGMRAGRPRVAVRPGPSVVDAIPGRSHRRLVERSLRHRLQRGPRRVRTEIVVVHAA